MRTTLQLDDDVFRYAKHLAAAQAQPLGKVVSELARQGMTGAQTGRQPKLKRRSGFAVFDVPKGGRKVTLEDVKRAEEEDDERVAGLATGR